MNTFSPWINLCGGGCGVFARPLRRVDLFLHESIIIICWQWHIVWEYVWFCGLVEFQEWHQPSTDSQPVANNVDCGEVGRERRDKRRECALGLLKKFTFLLHCQIKWVIIYSNGDDGTAFVVEAVELEWDIFGVGGWTQWTSRCEFISILNIQLLCPGLVTK